MKCQHCGSQDIVGIQGQNYCLNCGNLVEAPKPPAPTVVNKPKNTKAAAINQGAIAPEKSGKSQPAAVAKQETKTEAKPPSAHPLQFSLKAALTLGSGFGAVVAASLWFQLDRDTILVYVGGLGIVLSVVSATLAGAALTYGLSRTADGRPAPHSLWWVAARSGFMDLINLNLLAMIGMTAIFIVGAAAFAGVNGAGLPMPVALGVLGVINLALMWALMGVYAARHVAGPAVVIGNLSAWEAFKTGWRQTRTIYRSQRKLGGSDTECGASPSP